MNVPIYPAQTLATRGLNEVYGTLAMHVTILLDLGVFAWREWETGQWVAWMVGWKNGRSLNLAR